MTTTVTASELQKNFGKYKALARREPVEVTSNGERSVVVISVEDYDRLKTLDSRRAYAIEDLPDGIVAALDAEFDRRQGIDPATLPQTEVE